ncbi:helix-turn-helix domain-containing protein [Nocardia nova]|uniref:helix-turn-helix domain-containing protein n=1 Tax=Nocardia nova TaxID=37330 RepID=UPI0027E2AA71|nr:helix-turn-helix domain-containing protein [Nocardia nova]
MLACRGRPPEHIPAQPIPRAYALRCRIVLACAVPGAFNTHVAAQVGVSAMTVRKRRRRFIEFGLAGLGDEPRPGQQPPSILLDQVQQILESTLEQVSSDATSLVAVVDS